MPGSSPERVLVVKLGDLGDFILTTPALRALREALPDSRIDLLAQSVAAPLLRGTSLVDEHLVLPRDALERAARRGPAGIGFVAAFAGALRRRRYDAFVLLQHLTTRAGNAKYAGLALASGAPRRYGLDNGRGWFLTDRARDDGFSVHREADYWLRTVALLGADPRPRRPVVPVSPDEESTADGLLQGLKPPIVAIHPGSGGYAPARRWPAEEFVALGRRLATRQGASLVVVGTDRSIDGPVASALGARDLTGQTTVGCLAALLARIDLLVTNDCGVVHVGAAASAPMVAIYGQTDPRAWGAYYGDPELQERSAGVHVPLQCRPCLYRDHELGWRFGCGTRDCLRLVSVEMVLEAAERQLARFGPAIASDAR